jgi:hypothetical protein
MTNKYIVTTTINKPTEALIRYSKMNDWKLIVVGDLKTPHDLYRDVDCIYLNPEDQQKKYPDLSECLGWNTITRRNIGFVEAYNLGADVVATVDDDNIPYDSWGKNLCIGKEVLVDYYDASSIGVFDALSATNHPDLWHRGFPTERLSVKNNIKYLGKKIVKADVQADLWDGHPDVDAVCRLIHKPVVKFTVDEQYSSNCITPFNTQNTFMSKEAITKFMDLPFIGRMSDIWGAYMLQKRMNCSVVFSPASVYQDRNLQDTVTNMEHELIGYRHTEKFINDAMPLPAETKRAYEVYCSYFE